MRAYNWRSTSSPTTRTSTSTASAFKVVSATTDTAAKAAALNYLALAAGHDEGVIFLNTTDPADTSSVSTWGTQGMVASESFNFSNIPSAAIGDRAFVDANGNGIQDAGEAGLDGVTVRLLDAGDAIAAQVTSGGGLYLFAGLAPDLLHAVRDALGLHADGGRPGARRREDSDASVVRHDRAYTLVSGQTDLTVRRGVLPRWRGSGDRAFVDANGNGNQDAGEAGMVG